MAFAKMGDGTRAWELLDILNPIRNGDTPEKIARYRVEPYVIAADIYGVEPHVGRGGWTWYTGSAGWMYRLLVETLLGVNREGPNLRLRPIMPAGWNSFTVRYVYRATTYRIRIERSAQPGLIVDGNPVSGDMVPLWDDEKDHQVEMTVT